MGCVWNFCELSANVILLLTFCVKRELQEKQFSLFFEISSEKVANFCVISFEIT